MSIDHRSSMTIQTIRIGPFSLKAVDGLILATLGFFSLLALMFFWRVEGWWVLILKNAAVAALVLGSLRISARTHGRFLKFFVRMTAVTLTYGYLFGAVDKLQLILHGRWMDDVIIAAEQGLFGVQPTVWIQQFVSRPLTEWMMFSYVVYLPMYPILCAIIYYRHGAPAMEDYFFTLGFTNVLCDIGFILLPVASPMYYMKDAYTVPLAGWVWTYFGELMRTHLHFAGGSIPSPHAAAGTILWAMAYRYYRPAFWVMAPVMISLYISTFYGRYHYLSDAVVGILVALAALKTAPALMRGWDRIAERVRT